MPNWAGGVLTAKGRALQAKVEAGQTLELTKMKLGSGTPELEEIDNLTDLKQPQNIMGISSKIVENNICEVTSVILTSNINTPFYAREWGLFANDPDEGEILYMYTTDPNPDYIPNKNSALIISASYALNIAVLNVDNIIANIDPEGLITAGILEEELKKYLPLSGGIMEGLVSLFAGSTVTTPEEKDKSEKIANTQWVQDFIDNFLVGNVIYRPFLQEGYVKLNGATVQREDYPRLVQYATDNSLFTADNSTTPWLFGQGDGETTFVLPDYRNVFIEGGDTPSKINAGLPNITGSLRAIYLLGGGETSYTGAFYSGQAGGITWDNAGSGSLVDCKGIFEASRSSNIYGGSNTVQPPAIVLIPQIKY